MSMKKKKTVQKRNGNSAAGQSRATVLVKRSESVPKKDARPASRGIGGSIALLLDRTKSYLKPIEKADA